MLMQIRPFGMRKTPHPIQLVVSQVKSLPKVEDRQSALGGCAIQPIADRVFVDLNDVASRADGIFFRQSAHGQLKNSRISAQFVIFSRVSRSDSSITNCGAKPVFYRDSIRSSPKALY
jgi:hypothetical protein